MIDKNSIATIDFRQIHEIISFRRSRALLTVNHENLLSAWEVGAFVSERLQNSAWGSKTVMQLSEYLRTQDPTLRGYSRRNIYNMVLLYDTYSSLQFAQYQEKLNLGQIIQFQTGQIVQFQTAQFPNFLNLTTLTNHFEILNACKTVEERVFYVLYSHKEQLSIKELKRCIKNDAYSSVLGEKQGFSKGLKDTYPQAVPMLKDTLQVGFLELPKKHSEKRLQKGILDNMKDFVLELGKDFLFVDKEYALQVGNSTFKLDLLFYHRGLQCLVAIELKTGKFKPEYMGQLEFYLEALDRDVRHSNENPSIGILLCQETDRSVVEYAMSRSLSPTMIAKYERLFIPKEILQRSLGEFIHFLNPQEQFAQKGIN